MLYLVSHNFYCWLSYGLLFANEDKLTDAIGEYPRYTDQRHTLSFISSVDLGAAWSFALKAILWKRVSLHTQNCCANISGTWEWRIGANSLSKFTCI